MENTAPKPFVFVLMPFDKTFDDTYQLGIKPACVEAGAYCERVDEQIYEESMLQRVYNQIFKADIIVADMSTRNPNVFYEVGYAHALGKRVILLTQDAKDIPFDLKHFSHIVYGGRIVELKAELGKRVRWYVENPGDSQVKLERNLIFYFDGIRIEEGSVIDVPLINFYPSMGRKFSPFPPIRGMLAVHNPSSWTFEADSYKIALLTSKSLDYRASEMDDVREIDTPDTRIHYLPINTRLFPRDWHSIALGIFSKVNIKDKARVALVLCTLSELGRNEVHFFMDYSITEEPDLSNYSLDNIPR